MEREQLELSFNGAPRFRPVFRRHRRLTRARWWFDQMRRKVDQAFDWNSVPCGPPEQVCFDLARGRQVGEA